MLDLRTGKEMTRRETIKGGLGLAAILAAGKAPAMLLGARGVAFGKSLPYDAEVEWLQGGVIYTGVNVVSTGLEIEFGNMFTSTDSWKYGILASPPQQGKWFIFGGVERWPNRQIHVGSRALITNIGTVKTNVFYKVKGIVNSGVLSVYVDDVFTGDLNGVGDWSDEQLTFPGSPSIRCYYLKMSSNGDIIIDLIPVRIGNVGFMYDRVSEKLFGNYGTGNFVVGPDKN